MTQINPENSGLLYARRDMRTTRARDKALDAVAIAQALLSTRPRVMHPNSRRWLRETTTFYGHVTMHKYGRTL